MKAQTESITESKKAHGIEGVKSLIVAEMAKATTRADVLLEKGKAHTFRVEEVKGVKTSNPSTVRKCVIDNEKGTARLYFSASLVASVFCGSVGITAEEFKTLWAQYKGTPEYPFFSAVVLDYTDRADLLAALKQ